MGKKNTLEGSDVFALAAELQAHMEAAVVRAGEGPDASTPTPTPSMGSTVRAALAFAKQRLDASLQDLRRKGNEPPLVSIIIPVFNKAAYTVGCLESLSHQKSRFSFEVIVVDNASSDLTPQLVGSTPGVRYIRNKTNRGFVDGCNDGVAQARGKIVVLLNNDTVVLGNWLDALVERLESDPSIGLVGSKLVYPNGELQEAGGILFSDASGWNFGKHLKANDFEFNFCRDVDYCSGASIAFYRSDFNKLKGFDRRFAPAYYEDADLAMNMRYKLGKRVVYEPNSVLVHIEGGTAGTNTASGFKRYQAINHAKFQKKWAKELARYHYAPGTNPLLAARAGKPKRLLIVDSIVPEHNRDSGSLRMFQIIKASIALGYAVTFFADNRVATLPYTPQLQAMGVEVVYGGGLTLQDFYKGRTNIYDAVILSRPTIAIWHLEYCKAYQPKAHLIYDTVDLHYLRIERQAQTEAKPKLHAEAAKWQQLEYYLMDHTDATILVSYEELRLLKAAKPGLNIYTVSNINPRPIQTKQTAFADRAGLIFMGDYSRMPNYTAALWLVKDILPLIRKQLPDVTLTLMGSNPAAIQKLAGPYVTVTGFVEDKDPYYNQARVFVCPLRYGAGVKGKVSESIAYGLPVVSTAIGTEGMHLQHGVSCLEAETPQELASAVVKLYNDQKLWATVQTNAQQVYDDYFSEKAGIEALRHALSNR